MACRTLISLLLIVAAVNAFLPVANNRRQGGDGASKTTITRLEFGFLKELGLEKPSWLPDFGGKKEEDTTNDAPVATADEGDDAPAAAAAPEDDAPKDFGGKKEEDTTNDAPVATADEGDDAPAAAAAPEDDAPKDDDAPKED
eukprot:CAMPEP_0202506968 /NCGR_PEP_ID=MMETSP1361-20130828/51471_1 /ASSEMBLY_ACC=CAM_ASM_000849 /TAXON_ID=210615 /ORGANISM="Staurosira complex sp., Strain CCMP2646" /LENGTH=142 /DNA_ID=CAMNT_0049141059 /DNA_START=76 /DNA_END=504 /DNA_ORIENTATION=-